MGESAIPKTLVFRLGELGIPIHVTPLFCLSELAIPITLTFWLGDLAIPITLIIFWLGELSIFI